MVYEIIFNRYTLARGLHINVMQKHGKLHAKSKMKHILREPVLLFAFFIAFFFLSFLFKIAKHQTILRKCFIEEEKVYKENLFRYYNNDNKQKQSVMAFECK